MGKALKTFAPSLTSGIHIPCHVSACSGIYIPRVDLLSITISLFTHSLRETRYLLFLTENYAALDIVKHYLLDMEERVPRQEKVEPFILFGSSFPKDNDYSQVSQSGPVAT